VSEPVVPHVSTKSPKPNYRHDIFGFLRTALDATRLPAHNQLPSLIVVVLIGFIPSGAPSIGGPSQGRETGSRQAHNLEILGSTPSPGTVRSCKFFSLGNPKPNEKGRHPSPGMTARTCTARCDHILRVRPHIRQYQPPRKIRSRRPARARFDSDAFRCSNISKPESSRVKQPKRDSNQPPQGPSKPPRRSNQGYTAKLKIPLAQ
jgi:hypothetical protein